MGFDDIEQGDIIGVDTPDGQKYFLMTYRIDNGYCILARRLEDGILRVLDAMDEPYVVIRRYHMLVNADVETLDNEIILRREGWAPIGEGP